MLAGIFPARAAGAIESEFPFRFHEGLLWVDVRINQSSDLFHFLLDTGASVSVINKSAAASLGLKRGRPAKVKGVHCSVKGYWISSLSARAGPVGLPQKWLEIDLEQLSASCHQRVDGLIGADFFRGRVTQIDFETQTIRVLQPNRPVPSGRVLPLQFRTCGMRVPITVNGLEKQWMRVDTGCATALHWVNAKVSPEQCRSQSAIGLTQVSIPQTETSVELGGQLFEDVPTGLHTQSIFPGESGLLGNGLLARFPSITIDAQRGYLILHEQP